MNRVKLHSLAEMNSAIANLLGEIADFAAAAEKKLTVGPVAAQAKCAVARVLAKDAAFLLQAAVNHADFLFLNGTPVGEDNTASHMSGEMPSSNRIDVQEEIAIAMVKQVGFAREAVLPFLIECISVRLALSRDMLNQGKGKLAEAAAIEAAAS